MDFLSAMLTGYREIAARFHERLELHGLTIEHRFPQQAFPTAGVSKAGYREVVCIDAYDQPNQPGLD